MTDLLTPVLTADWGNDRAWTREAYEQTGGYDALRTALDMAPDDLITLVKDSGLRGRGGAGFPTGMKWSFIPQDTESEAGTKPKYLVVNADESEPGTCKDIPLMMASPHVLIEGAIIAAHAIRAFDPHHVAAITAQAQFGPLRRPPTPFTRHDLIPGADRAQNDRLHNTVRSDRCRKLG